MIPAPREPEPESPKTAATRRAARAAAEASRSNPASGDAFGAARSNAYVPPTPAEAPPSFDAGGPAVSAYDPSVVAAYGAGGDDGRGGAGPDAGDPFGGGGGAAAATYAPAPREPEPAYDHHAPAGSSAFDRSGAFAGTTHAGYGGVPVPPRRRRRRGRIRRRV